MKTDMYINSFLDGSLVKLNLDPSSVSTSLDLSTISLHEDVVELKNMLDVLLVEGIKKADLNSLIFSKDIAVLKGTVLSSDLLPTTGNQNGDVWLVGSKAPYVEYIYSEYTNKFERFGILSDMVENYDKAKFDELLTTEVSSIGDLAMYNFRTNSSICDALISNYGSKLINILVRGTNDRATIDLTVSEDGKTVTIPSTQAVTINGNVITIPDGTYSNIDTLSGYSNLYYSNVSASFVTEKDLVGVEGSSILSIEQDNDLTTIGELYVQDSTITRVRPYKKHPLPNQGS